MQSSDFGIFQNQWEISAKLNMVTPFRIGGGQNAGEYSLSQTPVLLSFDASTQKALPYIPGSSLKGVLRSNIERIIRTFNENKACIAVTDGRRSRREVKAPCGNGNCIACSIFGSMETGPKIHVRDSHLLDDMIFGEMVEERPHCRTDFDKVNGFYKVRINRGKPNTHLRSEEVVAANTAFDVNIILDNASEEEAGFILLALDEFNAKRCYIGGSVSRGNGFADVMEVKVIKKTLQENPESLFTVDEKEWDKAELLKGAKTYLKKIDDGNETQRKDFDVYYHAYNPLPFVEGNLVIKYKVETLTDFQMPGIDEATVADNGIPVIPGSTIKGFLRHEFLKSNNGYTAEQIDDIFGSTGSWSHRSRIIVSDAYPEDDFPETGSIPKGTSLTMWIVFDNIEEKVFNKVNQMLNEKPLITGKQVAGGNRTKDTSLLKNRVKFTMESRNQFTRNGYLN